MRYFMLTVLFAGCGGMDLGHEIDPRAGDAVAPQDAQATTIDAGDAIVEYVATGSEADAANDVLRRDADDPCAAVGSVRCAGAQPQICTAASAWEAVGSPCSAGCSDGLCLDCMPGVTQCRDGHLETCDAQTNSWRALDAGCY